MASFIAIISSYPAIIYTVLLGVILIYWLLAILGMIDIEALDIGMDADVDGVTGLASALMAVGLNGVPFSIVVSFLVLVSWLLTCLGMELNPLSSGMLQVLIGTGVMFISFALSIPITARIIRPMRGLFVTHTAVHNRDLVGRVCKVTTLSVNETFGQAFMEDGGGGLNLRIRAQTPNNLSKDSLAVIVEYHQASDSYEVVEAPRD